MTSKRTAETVRNMPASSASELKQRMVAAGSGFGSTCPKCGKEAATIVVERFGHCIACQNAAYFG